MVITMNGIIAVRKKLGLSPVKRPSEFEDLEQYKAYAREIRKETFIAAGPLLFGHEDE
jgi:hypothetical protein